LQCLRVLDHLNEIMDASPRSAKRRKVDHGPTVSNKRRRKSRSRRERKESSNVMVGDGDDEMERSLYAHLHDLRARDLNNIRFADYDSLFLSNLEVFDAVSMRWLPRSAMEMVDDGIIMNNYKMNGDVLWRERGLGALDIMKSPRINHTLTVVGGHLCIFGGIGNSDVLIVSNFVKTADMINDKFYGKESKWQSQSEAAEWGYDRTNAMSLSKHLFGASPTEYTQTTYTAMVQCANCLILECNRFNFRTCSGCAQVQYCSKACQKHHWNASHTHFCSKNHIRAS